MGLSFTIGGVPFGQVSSGTGRFAKEWNPSNQQYDVRRAHIPGTNGNLILRGGRTGGNITVVLKYCGPTNTIMTQYHADLAAWENTTVEIIGPSGASYERCNLVNMQIIFQPKGAQGKGAYLLAQAVFTVDS